MHHDKIAWGLWTILLAAVAVLPAGQATADEPKLPAELRPWVAENLADVVKLYRQLHAHPELSFHERETAATLAAAWRELGFEVTTGVGGHGVVAVLKNGDGPTLMLRTDMDALPVTEETELAYASQATVTNDSGVKVGVMHACGHDVHMANLVGVARYLSAHQDQWRGTLLLIGQPAEERGAGAIAMLEDGLFKRFPRPDFALALHVVSNLPAGQIGYREGYAMANVDSVDIVVRGRGGHASAPQSTVDPIVQAAELIVALQTIVSREVEPTEPAVVTVGKITGGTKRNIIGNTCELQLTVRTYSPKVRAQVLAAIRRKALGVAAAAGAPEPEVRHTPGSPSLFNDAKLVARVLPALRAAIGEEQLQASEPSMGGEDFSRYGKAGVPIFMYRLGTIESARLERLKRLNAVPSLHSSQYYPDIEPTLTTGIVTLTAAALQLLPTP